VRAQGSVRLCLAHPRLAQGDRASGLTVGELARSCLANQPAISKTVDKLVDQGLLERHRRHAGPAPGLGSPDRRRARQRVDGLIDRAIGRTRTRLLDALGPRSLVIWALASYGFGILLRPLVAGIEVGGTDLGFWFAQQGSILVFLVLIFFYAFRMNSIDKKFGVDE
jgi:putative solute:sodium symporter small subunit